MIDYNLSDIEKQAQDLGAVYLRHIFIDVSFYVNPSRKECFSTHYFNSDHKEIGYIIYSCGLYRLCGLTKFETPRNWHPNYINKKSVGEPIDFNTRGVKQFV